MDGNHGRNIGPVNVHLALPRNLRFENAFKPDGLVAKAAMLLDLFDDEPLDLFWLPAIHETDQRSQHELVSRHGIIVRRAHHIHPQIVVRGASPQTIL